MWQLPMGGGWGTLRTRKNQNLVRVRWGGAVRLWPARGTRTRHLWPVESRTACWTLVIGPRATAAAWTCCQACRARGRPANHRCRCRTTMRWIAAAKQATLAVCNRRPCARNGIADRKGSNRLNWTSGTVLSCTWDAWTPGADPVHRERTDTCRRTHTWFSRCTDGTFPSCIASPSVPGAATAVDRQSVAVVAAVAAYQIHRPRDDPVPGGVWVPMTRIPDCCSHCCCCPSTTPSLATSVPLLWPLRAVDSVSWRLFLHCWTTSWSFFHVDCQTFLFT